MYKSLIVFSCGWLAIQVGMATDYLTPESAVNAALESNRDLLTARQLQGIAEARLAQSGLRPNPEIELANESDLLFGNEGEYALSIGFKQKFPLNGRLAKAKDVARVDVALAQEEIRDQERLLIGNTLSLSYEILNLQQREKTIGEILSLLTDLLRVSEKRLKVGEGSQTDALMTKLEIRKLEIERASVLAQKNERATFLKGLIGRPPDSTLEIRGASPESFDKVAVRLAMIQAPQRRPDRQIAALLTDRASAEIRLTRAERREDWTFGFELSQDNSQFDQPIGGKRDTFIGFNVSVPLPVNGSNRGRLTEIQLLEKQNRSGLEALEIAISTEIQAAYNRMESFANALKLYQEDTFVVANESIELARQGYANGLVPLSNLFQAQQQYIELRLAYIETLDAFAQAWVTWQTAAAANPQLR